MASFPYMVFVGWFLLMTCICLVTSDMVMDPKEMNALLEVMDSIAEEPTWRAPYLQPCTENSWPAIECEAGEDNHLHITKLRIGLDKMTTCKPNATLSPSFSQLQHLKSLFIYNCINNPQPNKNLFHLLPSLQELVLKSNKALLDHVPSELQNLAQLRVLSISQSGLKGTIPKELGSMKSLEHVDLSYNNLSGEIPESFGGLENLLIIELQGNKLQGSVPKSLGSMRNLQKMDISANNLKGRLPRELGGLVSLRFMTLANNAISGPLPETLKHLMNLQYLILDGNPLNSTLPEFLGAISNLYEVSLSSTSVKGPMPLSLCSLHDLKVLSLDNNMISGGIPGCIGILRSLVHLNLSENQLSGRVAFSEEFVKKLGRRLQLGGNKGLCVSREMSDVLGGQVSVCSVAENDRSPRVPGVAVPSPGFQPGLAHRDRVRWSLFIIMSFLGNYFLLLPW